jgi:hypothetical protein
VVLHFIDEIVVHDRRELRVRFKVPFDNLGVEHLCDEAEGRGQNERRPAGEAGLRGFPDILPSGPKWLPTTDGARTRYQGLFLRLSKRFPRVRRGGDAKAVPGKRVVTPEERAARWAAMIDGEIIKSRADLARALGVSRARVTQVLGSFASATSA